MPAACLPALTALEGALQRGTAGCWLRGAAGDADERSLGFAGVAAGDVAAAFLVGVAVVELHLLLGPRLAGAAGEEEGGLILGLVGVTEGDVAALLFAEVLVLLQGVRLAAAAALDLAAEEAVAAM